MPARIYLVHALVLSMTPTREAFERMWPDAETYNLLDDSLSEDRAREGAGTNVGTAVSPRLLPMRERFLSLGRYCAACGADALLFTCSAFGREVEAVKANLDIPVLKPNEAMLEEAAKAGVRLGLLATFTPTIASMADELSEVAKAQSVPLELETACVEGALAALRAGDGGAHDRLIAEQAERMPACEAFILAQFSMARAAAALRGRGSRPVFTAPDSAVRKLKELLGA